MSSLALSLEATELLEVTVRLQNAALTPLDMHSLPSTSQIAAASASPSMTSDTPTAPFLVNFQICNDDQGPPFLRDNHVWQRDASASSQAIGASQSVVQGVHNLPSDYIHFPILDAPNNGNSLQPMSSWAMDGFPPWCAESGFYPIYNTRNIAGAPAAMIHRQLDPWTNDSGSDNITFDGHASDFDLSVGRHDMPFAPHSGFSSPSSISSSCSATFSDTSSCPPATSLSNYDVDVPSFPDMAQASWTSQSASEPTRLEPSPSISDQENASSRRRFACLMPGCTRRFTSQYTLKVHMEAHKPKPRTSFPCTLGCSETFSRQHDRLRHEVAKHGKVCDWLCGDCGRFFSSKKTLGNHKCPCAPGGTRWVTETEL